MHPAVGLGLFAVLAWLLNKKDTVMAAVQKQFDEFHSRIKLDEDDEKMKLREKRETLINELRARLPADIPAFENFNQGSYSMHTGTVPVDGNFDIDVGLLFDCKRDKYNDPVELKKKVRDALKKGNRTVDIRRSCVTVSYMKDGKPEYHVDLVVYVKRDDGKLDLAKGKEHSEQSKRVWEVSEPKRLTELLSSRFTEEDLAQYRRCIRYLKRWRDVQFSSGAPLSIALTVAAYHWFNPNKDFLSNKYIDLIAMRNWVTEILGQFQQVTRVGGTTDRLKVTLPVTPDTDLMGWMSNEQMDNFKVALKNLLEALEQAVNESLPEDACMALAAQFGDHFPVPPKEETTKAVRAPYVNTGSSA